MEAIHKLKVICPYEIIKIEDININSKPNEHGYLYLKCLIDDNIKFKYSIEATTEDTIILYEQLESGEKSIIFNGIIENIRTTNENGVYYLELEGASRSSILDIKQKSRSFQDVKMSYNDLINEILKDYKGLGFTQCMSKPMYIGKPLFQYKETDYEFLRRIASLLGLEIICDIINSGNAFYFGRPEGKMYELKDEMNYKACKDLERYYKAKTRGFGVDFHDTDFFYYEVENRVKMDIGDKICFKQKDLYVNQYEAELHKGDLIYKYKFCRKNGIWQEKIYNHKIKGISLEGEVLETVGEKLKLHLYIDESQDPSKAAWFYYAPPTGNILYSMPLVGENATLYFQDEIDAAPIVTSCVRKNGSTCEAMADTTNRYYATESGNYLDMLPGTINFHRSGLNVNFNDEKGIDFSSFGNLSVGAAGSVSLSAGSVSISAASKLLVQKGKVSYVSLENEFYAKANVVYEDGSCRESYGAFTDDEPTAGAAEAKAKLEKQLKQAAFEEMQLMGAMAGSEAKSGAFIVPASKDSVPLEGEALKNRDDIPTFDVDKVYEEGTIVKQQSLDGTYILGSAGKIQNEQRGGVSQFTPCDSKSYSEHNSYSNSFKSMGLAGADFLQETLWMGAKGVSYVEQAGDWAASKIGLTRYSEDSWELARNECDEISSSWHNTIYNMAPHKVVFNSSESIINIYTALSGIRGIVSSITNLPKILSGGMKLAAIAPSGKIIENISSLQLDVAGVAKGIAKAGIYTSTTNVAINNMVDDVVKGSGTNNVEKAEYGEHYTKGKNGRKELKPNVEYTTPSGHTYSTDDVGRIKEVNGTLNKHTAKRNKYDQKVAGREDRLDTDDGGHLIASIFDGSGDLDNIVPMDATLNRGDWKAMENSWAKALKENPPKTVEVKISPKYSGDSMRPTSFDVKYRIDNGRWIKETFKN